MTRSSDPEPSRNQLSDLAASLSDGTPIDWCAAEDRSDPSAAKRLAALEDLSKVIGFYRAWHEAGDEPEGAVDALEPQPQGKRFGPFLILERIGEGATAEVFRARDTRLEREVALKKFRTVAGRSDEAVLQEARRLAKVRHPNVVTVYGADLIEGHVCLWMEYVRGISLEALLREPTFQVQVPAAPAGSSGSVGRTSASEAARIGRDLCAALAALHAAGLVHGDVKAQNVLREEGGRIVLMDLGSGRELTARSEALDLPRSGTPLYLAPELLVEGSPGVQSDLFALGVLLFHLVTGEYPIRASSWSELCEAHRRGARLRLLDLRPDLPAPFVHAVERALSPEPRDRPRSAGEMATLLGKSEAAREDPIESAHDRRHRRPRRVWMTALVGVTVGVLAMVLARPRISNWSVDAALFRKNGDGVERLSSGSSVRVGDGMYLEFEPSRAVHLYVLSEDDRGAAHLLYPFPGSERAVPLAGGQRHRLPPPIGGRNYLWGVSSAGGHEHLLLVASPEPIALLEREIANLPRLEATHRELATLFPQESAMRLRGIAVLLEDGPATPTPTRLTDLARELSATKEASRGIWLRKISLENRTP